MTGEPTSLAEFELPREVRFVDTDASGFAHFASYIRMMEETEYAFLRSRGLCVVLYDERGTMGFPRLSANLTVNEPLAFGQKVLVKLFLIDVDGKQVTYRFQIRSLDSTEVAVEGQFVAACCRFPDGDLPYAILFPEFVVNALEGSVP